MYWKSSKGQQKCRAAGQPAGCMERTEMEKVIGYVGSKDLMQISEPDVRALDVINIAFAGIENGCVVWGDRESCKAVGRLRRIHPEIKLLLSVGGWGADGFSQAARTQEGRERFARSSVQLMEKYGLDGIDIDWEYPGTALAGIEAGPDDRENFTLLLKAIRSRLNALRPDGMLSIAAGGDTYYTKLTDMQEAAKYLDYVQLMTYDLQGGFQKVTGHHTSLYTSPGNLIDACVDKAVRVFEAAGVPGEKLIIGAAFYSREWKGVKNVGTGLGIEAETVGGYGPDYGELTESFIKHHGFQRYWDEAAKAPYLFNGSEFISYEDKKSLACKVAYVKEKGLGGIMFWEHKCDSTGTLTEYIRSEMDRRE